MNRDEAIKQIELALNHSLEYNGHSHQARHLAEVIADRVMAMEIDTNRSCDRCKWERKGSWEKPCSTCIGCRKHYKEDDWQPKECGKCGGSGIINEGNLASCYPCDCKEEAK
jgi:hypothetical protein